MAARLASGQGFAQFSMRTPILNPKVVTGPGGLAELAVRQAAGRVRDRTKRNITNRGRVDTGKMRQSVDYHIKTQNAHEVVAEVGIYTAYANWQEQGTAGAGAGWIYPRRAKVLRFKGKGAAGYTFAKRVRGVKPMNALKDAIESLSDSDFTLG
jgi:Bacteriophage HK97-gp10, putative tail-component